VRTKLQKKRVAVIYENTSYGRGLVEPFLDGLGFAPIALEPIDPSGESIAVNVAALARQNPDIILAVGTTVSGVSVINEIRAHGLTIPVIAGDGWSGLENEAELRNVMMALTFANTMDRPEGKRFVQAFRERYKVDPDSYAALSYDATLTMARAAAAGKSREGARRVLAEMNDANGYAVGAVKFAADGEPVDRDMLLLQFDGDKRTVGVMK
jgi:branched-chain amino acid transport system substrate-binding protein